MSIKKLIFSTPLLLISLNSFANDTLDAAIGGAIGGATGAAIGNELGGRDGAILGGAIGGATGAAIATDNNQQQSGIKPAIRIESQEPPVNNTNTNNTNNNNGTFCPPGQRKKGRC